MAIQCPASRPRSRTQNSGQGRSNQPNRLINLCPTSYSSLNASPVSCFLTSVIAEITKMTKIEEQISLYCQGLFYFQIAEHTNTTAAQVERSIRAWKLQPKQVEPTRCATRPQATVDEIKVLREHILSLRTDGQSMKAIGHQGVR